jgi:hypothetical protein
MKPIIFNTEMVQAILDGRKTQTRRVIKPQPENVSGGNTLGWSSDWIAINGGKLLAEYELCQDIAERWVKNHPLTVLPYQPGDVLYVRETWATGFTKTGEEESIFYKAGGYNQLYMLDGAPDYEDWLKLYDTKETAWRPSIHMPQWAARLFLRVTDVRAQRVQEISEEDARAEGFSDGFNMNYWSATTEFKQAWDSIYHNWDANPWVWAYTFERVG